MELHTLPISDRKNFQVRDVKETNQSVSGLLWAF